MSAALRFVRDPVTVIEPEPFAPAEIVNPLVVESVSVPVEADNVSVSELAPGPESATVIALPFAELNVSVPLMLTDADVGAVILGPSTARLMLFDADSLSPESAIETVRVASPEYPVVG